MSTSKRTVRAALEAGNLQAAVAALRQDVVFHSRILATVRDEVRGLPTVVKALQTAFTCLGMPQNVEEFQNPDGRYIVTFDGAIEGNLIQIAMLVTEDAQGKVESIRAFTRPWPVVNSSASIWSATCARIRCTTRSGNSRRPRHDNRRADQLCAAYGARIVPVSNLFRWRTKHSVCFCDYADV
jgi:hypothetical protein